MKVVIIATQKFRALIRKQKADIIENSITIIVIIIKKVIINELPHLYMWTANAEQHKNYLDNSSHLRIF